MNRTILSRLSLQKKGIGIYRHQCDLRHHTGGFIWRANAYLGLRVGMTVSASIPAAVISMGVIRIILRKDSVLENNMVQTIGSAGESLAAGAIFTMPVLFMWAAEGKSTMPGLGEIALICICGGALGVFFHDPAAFRTHCTGTWCTAISGRNSLCRGIVSRRKGGAKAGTVFAGLGIALFTNLSQMVCGCFQVKWILK